jgi:CubicO group peptidase (beta-lactamase class C family)
MASSVRRVVPATLFLAAIVQAACAGEDIEADDEDEAVCVDGKCDLFEIKPPRAATLESWGTGLPGTFDLDSDALDVAADRADDAGSRCLLVVRDGKLVYERYFNGANAKDLNDSWSIAKTFTSALVGIAIGRGDLPGLDTAASKLVPEWRDGSHDGVTLRNLLSGTSGLEYKPILGLSIDMRDYTWLFLTHDLTREAVRRPLQVEPMTRWRYDNHAVQVLDRVLEEATGEHPETYARDHLWNPIGMTVASSSERKKGTHWRRDKEGSPTMFTSVRATCRGLAKFGELLRNDGAWNGKQIIPADYVSEMHAGSSLNRAYGLLTWTNEGFPAYGNSNEAFDGRPFPGAPANLISAQGVGQNFIDVLPDEGMVIVHVRAPRVLDVNEMLKDGRQALHRELLDLVLAADVR